MRQRRATMTISVQEHVVTISGSSCVIVARLVAVLVALLAAMSVPAANWIPVGSMLGDRHTHQDALMLDGRVLVYGGYTTIATPGISTSAEVYDPTTQVWSDAASLSRVRHAPLTRLADGKVLVGGGLNSASSTSEAYSPATNSWSDAGFLTSSHGGKPSATLLTSGLVLVAGGLDTATSQYTAKATSFNPVTAVWQAAAAMNTGRNGHTSTLLLNGNVLVVGGANISGVTFQSELYDPVLNIWSPTVSDSLGHRVHTATRLLSGKVLVVGGLNDQNEVVSTTEMFDPASNTWSDGPSMSVARKWHTATLLHSGSVLVVGGVSSNNPEDELSSVELYDPATNSWAMADSLPSPRAAHTATLLYSGSVLVAGGITGGSSLKSSFLYQESDEIFASSFE